MPQPKWTLAQGSARVCFGNASCVSLDYALASGIGDWRSKLPSTELPGNGGENCNLCNGSMLSDRGVLQNRGLEGLYRVSPRYPHETWNLTATIVRMSELPMPSALDFVKSTELDVYCRSLPAPAPAPAHCRSGYVPTLAPHLSIDVMRGWRSFRRGGSPPFFLPCSSARGEDAAVMRTFFSDVRTGRPIRGGTFLEIGGVDGLTESNTWVIESCFGWQGTRQCTNTPLTYTPLTVGARVVLGWQGVLVEGHPIFFEKLIRQRPRSLNVHLAACRCVISTQPPPSTTVHHLPSPLLAQRAPRRVQPTRLRPVHPVAVDGCEREDGRQGRRRCW